MFITFEGIDGAGKTTQLKLLEKYLESKGLSVLTIREPGGTVISEKIRDILLFSKQELTPWAELFLFEAARSTLVSEVITPALKSGKAILSDRFYDSTLAYQGFGRGLDIDFITQCNNFASNNIKPDITFFLDIVIDDSKQRGKHKNPDRMESSGDEFFLKVIEGFKEIAKAQPERFYIIDSSKKVELVHEQIINIVNQKIKF